MRRLAPLLVATLLALPAGAGARTLAPTPYMGWDSSYAFGTHFDEATILEQASNLQSEGLERDGYKIVWLDAGWWQGHRSHDGTIEVSASQWPHGIAWLAATLHREGFELGLYTDAGARGCAGPGEGMWGHYRQDIDTFARWGVDALKVDFCGGDDQHLQPSTVYGEIHDAIVHDTPHRAMMLEVCVFARPGGANGAYPPFGRSAFASWSFAPAIATSWRTDTDIGSYVNGVQWPAVVRNMLSDATEPLAAGPGHWNDPGYLSPDLGMDAAQFQTQMSMWAMLAAPLMISANLATLTPASFQTVTNRTVIGIDQDQLGRQAVQVPPADVTGSPNGEAWIRPLTHGRWALALLNLGSTPLTIATKAPLASYELTDAWSGASSTGSGTISAPVAGDSTALFIVGAASG